MTYDEFIERVLAIGYDVHLNEGVWWIKTAPFFYEPVVPYQVLEYASSKPKFHKALLGYSYLVSNEHYANRYRSIMLMNEERLKCFGMNSLPSKRRNKVKKGLKLTENRKIDSVEDVIDDMKEILISKAKRTHHEVSPDYYVKHYQEWRDSVIKQFNIDKGKKEYWGSFYNGSLIAFFTMIQINDTMIINTGSSHTDHLDKCPNDALRFVFLEYCRDLKDCKKVISGLWSDNKPSLNEFKESYGFDKVDLPVYTEYRFPFIKVLAMKLKRNKTN